VVGLSGTVVLCVYESAIAAYTVGSLVLGGVQTVIRLLIGRHSDGLSIWRYVSGAT